jgi:uncharacterized protein
MVSGKRSLFVDTSGWIAVYGKNESSHEAARDAIIRAVKEHRPIITTNYIIAEFIGRAENACRLTREELLKAVDDISNLPRIEVIHISKESHDLAIVFLRARLDKKWSLVDATSFNLMTQLGIREALTTDHHFVQAEFIKLL